MHPNPAYRQTPADRNLSFAAARGFGTLAVNADAGPLLSHIPFVLTADRKVVEFHLVRSNPIVRALASGAVPAVLAVTGPDGYISPDWYQMEHQVPTWNYVAVHLRGAVEMLTEAALGPILDRMSARFEGDLAPKAPWTADKMPGDALARLMRQVVPCRMVVADVQGTWKLAQNKPESARLAAAAALDAADISPEASVLAALMAAAGVV